jgi:hypothetical protein
MVVQPLAVVSMLDNSKHISMKIRRMVLKSSSGFKHIPLS